MLAGGHQTLKKSDLPADEEIAWCKAMTKSDRVGFIYDRELRGSSTDSSGRGSKPQHHGADRQRRLSIQRPSTARRDKILHAYRKDTSRIGSTLCAKADRSRR